MRILLVIKSILITFLLMITFASCEPTYPARSFDNLEKVAIIKEIPKIYHKPGISYIYQEVIRSQEELEAFLSSERLESRAEFEDIDWATQTLLLDYFMYSSTVSFSHKFLKENDSIYVYIMEYSQIVDEVPDNFISGIVVEKLKESVIVEFMTRELPVKR